MRTQVKIIVPVSMPGGGKSYLANKLHQDNPDIVVVDDPVEFDEIANAIATVALKGSGAVVICDCFLCELRFRNKEEHRIRSEFPEYDFNFVYYFFENNPDQCRKNAAYRASKGDTRNVEGSIRRFTENYDVPEGVKLIPIWKCPISINH